MEAANRVSFGYKCAWLAIKSEDPQAVIETLDLQNVRLPGWKQGVAAAYAGEVFVTPPLNGWVLAASISLLDIADKTRPDKPLPLIELLATRFPDVQYFGTHRIVEYHAWLRAIDGKIVRSFAYLGERSEVLCDEGECTAEEKALGLIYDDSRSPDEEDVMQLAGAWSINPQTLGDLALEKSFGSVGSLPKK